MITFKEWLNGTVCLIGWMVIVMVLIDITLRLLGYKGIR